ncbi:MAG: porin family protein [Bacteroidia bacterium]
MKRTLLFTAVFLSAFSALAYTPGDGEKTHTIEIHGKGLANSTFLFNKNVSDAGDEMDYAAGWGFNYGLGFSMYFGKVGFGVEGLMGNHRGAYAGTQANGDDYSSNVNLKITQVPVFFKLKSETGGFLEIGPQYNLVNEATYHFTTTGQTVDSAMTDYYAKSYFSAVLGAGFKIPVAKSRFSFTAGIRFQYSLTDLKGVDAMGIRFIDPFKYKTPQRTDAATAGFMLGVCYTIGEKKKETK